MIQVAFIVLGVAILLVIFGALSSLEGPRNRWRQRFKEDKFEGGDFGGHH